MFADEARIASRVHHSNVCATWEFAEYEGIRCLSMEWVDGPSLMRVLRPGPEDDYDLPTVAISPRLAAKIVAEVCAGLHAAHELHDERGRSLAVVHRDVSPHNILVTSTDLVKVTDFGVAKALGKSNVTVAGQIKGKLAYMSPEQLTGGGIDRRSDVFALGCVLYEATLGQKPFQGEHDPQVMTAIMLGRFDPPHVVDPNYPQRLGEIVVKALASEPSERFSSADEMRIALDDYLRFSGPPVTNGHVADLLRERCDADLARRAQALISEVSSTDAMPFTRRPSGSGTGMEIDPRPGPGPDRRPLIWGITAAVLGAAVGIGVLLYVRGTRHAKPTAAATDTTASRGTTTAMAGTATGSATAVSSVGPRPLPVDRGAGRVHLNIRPSTAVLVVDGVVLPRGTQILARPDGNATMNVLVRADKFDDTIVLVDQATPDEVEINLVPSTPGAPRVLSDGGVRVARDAGAAAAGSAAPSAGSATTDAPPNPYD